KVLRTNPKYFKIEVYCDETSLARIVLVEEDYSRPKDIDVTWHKITSQELPEKLAEIQEKMESQKNSQPNTQEAKYRQYYEEAQEYCSLGNYRQAEKPLKRIINSKEIFAFTSGAYVTLASIQ